jgi:hypothetical protein
MRTRTLLAGATLALLTVAWSAPGAMAADNNDGNGSQPPSSALPRPVPPAGSTGNQNNDADRDRPSPSPAPPAPPPKPPVAPKPADQQPGDVGVAIPDPKASLSVSPNVVRPGDTLTANPRCENGRVDSLSSDGVNFQGNRGTVDRNAGDGNRTVTLVCVNGTKRDTASATFRVERGPGGPGPGGPGPGGPGPGGPGPGNDELQATLSVSPRTVKQGDTVYFNGGCSRGRQVSLSADGVDVSGRTGTVDDNAREGDHTATRVCADGSRRDTATDTFRVVRGDGDWSGDGPRDFWLSDRSGYRGDSVDVSVRCRDNSARLESDALQDITLRRDRGRLTGTARVVDRVGNGWHRVTVSCDGHSDSQGFWVLSDRGDHDRYLSVDPSYGHRGDEVDIRVGCDWSVGRVESDALDDIDLDDDGKAWRYSGTTHVSDDAPQGEHTVRVRCGDDTMEESFFVQGDGDREGDDDSPGGGDQVSVYPVGAPETGGGPAGADAGASGAGSPGAVALGLIGITGAAMAGTGAVLARRRTRR